MRIFVFDLGELTRRLFQGYDCFLCVLVHIFRGCFNSKADVVEYIKKEDRDKKMKREERPETRLCYWKLCNSVSMSDLEGYEHRGSGGEIKTTSNVIFLTSLITIFNVNCRIKY